MVMLKRDATIEASRLVLLTDTTTKQKARSTAIEILERTVDGLIQEVVSIDDSQSGFVPGRGTTDAIFVIRQLQEKCLAVNTHINMAFPDLEKAVCVPRIFIWWEQKSILPRE